MSSPALLSMIFLLLLSSVSPLLADDLEPFSGSKGVLKIGGGTAHIPVMKEAAKIIMQKNRNIHITIAGGGSGVGIKQVGEGMIDIGNAGRKATPKEIKRYNLHMVKWAIDGVGVVVNPANRVTSLTTEQLMQVFAGIITNWNELGGANRKINLYDRDTASGTRSVFWKKALRKGEVSKKANVVASNGAMKTAIAGDPYGIGYVSVGHIDSTLTPVALDGVLPSLENVKSGRYVVARGLYSLTRGEPTGLARLFLEFLLTPSGQNIAQSKGYIPVL
jgi:phosphate transport system substrate-binding protein